MSSQTEHTYPWYDVVEGPEILQGDLLDRAPVVVPKAQLAADETVIDAEVFEYDVIVMSQSCDLAWKKVNLVLVCPVWSYESLSQKYSHLKTSSIKKQLQQGYVPGYHLIRQCELEGQERPIRVVDFKNIYALPFDFISQFAELQGKRLRLLPPYREHLSQAFARYFMRVGLPIDVEIP